MKFNQTTQLTSVPGKTTSNSKNIIQGKQDSSIDKGNQTDIHKEKSK